MRTTDWKYDFASLPRWDNRIRNHWVYDEFFEIPQTDTLVCIYSVVEARMLDYLGFLAVLKNKQSPELILNVTDGINFEPQASVSDDGTLVFLTAQMYSRELNRLEQPLVIIDLEKMKFSFVKTGNYNPLYRVVELDKGVFGIEADEQQKKHDERLAAFARKKLRPRWLKWYPVSELKTLPLLVF